MDHPITLQPSPATNAVASESFALSPLQEQVRQACAAWLAKSPSADTRSNYLRDLHQFLSFADISPDHIDHLLQVRPHQIAAWRDRLKGQGLTNSSIRRKLTVLRSLFSYLQNYGYAGKNPAHSDFVQAPSVPRDGKTVGLSAAHCRLLLESPPPDTPQGLRDRALLAVLAYTGCRVGELCRLRVGDYKNSSGHRLLEVHGKGGKERRVALHAEAVERIERWLDLAGLRGDPAGPLFRPAKAPRGKGAQEFLSQPMSRRAVQYLIQRYVRTLQLDPAVTVHSFRVTALTVARERGSDILDLQDFAGHADPRTTLTYIRQRDRLSNSPAYVLKY